MCCFSRGIEKTIDFFLHYANFNTQTQSLFDKMASTDANILTENENGIFNTILYGKPNSENSFNKAMLNALMEFILSTSTIHYSDEN